MANLHSEAQSWAAHEKQMIKAELEQKLAEDKQQFDEVCGRTLRAERLP